ncbi:hypothetical protein CSC64_01345 [Pseudoxanthomonas koreensis]|nr:hypothetical protein CSC64_01345 [Pseudoxanthomonas koreensis]
MAALVLALPLAAPRASAAEVTVYRCSDSQGRLVALRDSPCLAGERQEAVQMQRPQDPPPRATTPVLAPAPAAPPREVRIVTVQAPRPMYECTAPDGTTYTSESAGGNPRQVPVWTLGYPVITGGRPGGSRPPVTGPAPRPPIAGPGPRPPLPGAVLPATTWVRDPCVELSRDEICTRLSDRRYEILRVYHAAMPSQREELDREQRRIDTHMTDHCSGY